MLILYFVIKTNYELSSIRILCPSHMLSVTPAGRGESLPACAAQEAALAPPRPPLYLISKVLDDEGCS